MFFFAPILATFASVGVLSAAIADVDNISHHHERQSQPALAASASCTAKDNLIFTSYSVNIPVSYPAAGSVFCDGLYNLIHWGQYPLNSRLIPLPPLPSGATEQTKQMLAAAAQQRLDRMVTITNWQCVQGTSNPQGSIQLWFNGLFPSQDVADRLNGDLKLAFPGFNFTCPSK
jgi:hypothetical protein